MTRRMAAIVAVPLVVAAVGVGASLVGGGASPAPAGVLVGSRRFITDRTGYAELRR